METVPVAATAVKMIVKKLNCRRITVALAYCPHPSVRHQIKYTTRERARLSGSHSQKHNHERSMPLLPFRLL